MLRDEGRGSTGNRHRNRSRSFLVIAQVALSTILLIGSGLLVRSFVRLRSAYPGFEPKNLLTLHVSLRKYAQSSQSVSFYQEVIRRVNALPGVATSAISTALPLAATHRTRFCLRATRRSHWVGGRSSTSSRSVRITRRHWEFH